MKNTKVLSLLLLFASAQMHGSSGKNPELSLVFAFQYVNNLSEAISSDNDDTAAIKLLQAMNDYIAFDASQKKALAASQNSYLYKGVPLDTAKIAAQDKELQDKIHNYNKDIKALQGSNKTLALAHKKKIEDRRHSRDAQQRQLDENLAAIKDNASAADAAQANAAAVNALISKNALAFEQALESYIASFGQCYSQSGSVYGSKIVISSKYRQDMAITPKEYAQLVTTLNNAYSQFGSAVTITLSLNHGTQASIKDVAGYVNNMAPQSSSYATYAAYGVAAAAATTAAIAGGAIAYNMYQGQDLSDATNKMISDAGNLYNSGVSGLGDLYTWGVNALGYQTSSQKEQALQNALILQAAANAKAAASTSNNQDEEQYYNNLFDEIDATMNQTGGMNLTPEEIHALAPYAAGVLGASLVGGAGAVGAASLGLGMASIAEGVSIGLGGSGAMTTAEVAAANAAGAYTGAILPAALTTAVSSTYASAAASAAALAATAGGYLSTATSRMGAAAHVLAPNLTPKIVNGVVIGGEILSNTGAGLAAAGRSGVASMKAAGQAAIAPVASVVAGAKQGVTSAGIVYSETQPWIGTVGAAQIAAKSAYQSSGAAAAVGAGSAAVGAASMTPAGFAAAELGAAGATLGGVAGLQAAANTDWSAYFGDSADANAAFDNSNL